MPCEEYKSEKQRKMCFSTNEWQKPVKKNNKMTHITDNWFQKIKRYFTKQKLVALTNSEIREIVRSLKNERTQWKEGSSTRKEYDQLVNMVEQHLDSNKGDAMFNDNELQYHKNYIQGLIKYPFDRETAYLIKKDLTRGNLGSAEDIIRERHDLTGPYVKLIQALKTLERVAKSPSDKRVFDSVSNKEDGMFIDSTTRGDAMFNDGVYTFKWLKKGGGTETEKYNLSSDEGAIKEAKKLLSRSPNYESILVISPQGGTAYPIRRGDAMKENADSIMKRAWQMDAAEYEKAARQTTDSIRGDASYDLWVLTNKDDEIRQGTITAKNKREAELKARQLVRSKGLKDIDSIVIRPVGTGNDYSINP